jgi:regulator of chromosome condensation
MFWPSQVPGCFLVPGTCISALGAAFNILKSSAAILELSLSIYFLVRHHHSSPLSSTDNNSQLSIASSATQIFIDVHLTTRLTMPPKRGLSEREVSLPKRVRTKAPTPEPKVVAAPKKITTTKKAAPVPKKAPAKAEKEPSQKRKAGDEIPSAKRVKAVEPTTKTRPTATPKTRVPKTLPVLQSPPTERLTIFACGEGSAGELGLGTKKSTDVKRPRINAFLDPNTVGVVQMSAGGMHCIALTHDNKILTWGVNDNAALGRDTNWEGGLKDVDADSDSESDDDLDTGLNPKESTPTEVPSESFPAGTTFVEVAAGDSCSFALTNTGLVYGWGTFRVSKLFHCL